MKRKTTILLIVILLCSLIPIIPHVKADEYIEEQTIQTASSSTWGGGRDGQHLIINYRNVSKLSFFISKVGSPTGNIIFTIRKVSDDSILLSKVWGDASTLSDTLTWRVAIFDSPLIIQEDVRIALEFDGGDADNYILSGRAGNVKGGEIYTYYDAGEWTDYEGDFCYKYNYSLPIEGYTIETGYDISATADEWQRKTFKNPRGLGYYYALIKTGGSRWRFYKSLNGSSWSAVVKTTEGFFTSPPALSLYEDENNNRLIVYVVYHSGTKIFAFAKTIEDDSIDFSFIDYLWWVQVAERTDTAGSVYFPNICIDESGYLWVSWTDVYGNKADHAQIRVARSTTPNATSAPEWTLATIYGELGGEFGSKGLDFGNGPMPRSEIISLNVTADVGIVMGYYDDSVLISSIDGMTLTYSAGIQEGSVVENDATVHQDLIHSTIVETGSESDIFIGYKDVDDSFKCVKWDISESSSTGFGVIYSLSVNSISFGIDKNTNPNTIYAFYVNSSVDGNIFYKTSGVDSASWSSEKIINDDLEPIDYLSSSYQGLEYVQIIYTRQTFNKVRFWIDGPSSIPDDPINLFGAGFNATYPYVELHWNHSLLNFNFFEIQNSSDRESWEYLGQSATLNYTDYQVIDGTERYYKVRACKKTGDTWYNSSFGYPDFEIVYFIPSTDGIIIQESDAPWIALAIILSIIAFLLAMGKRK